MHAQRRQPLASSDSPLFLSPAQDFDLADIEAALAKVRANLGKRRPPPTYYEVDVTLEELYTGCTHLAPPFLSLSLSALSLSLTLQALSFLLQVQRK